MSHGPIQPLTSPEEARDMAESMIDKLYVEKDMHQVLADRARPQLLGLVGDAHKYQFHRAAWIANLAMIQRLRHPNCDKACIVRVHDIREKFNACVARHVVRADYSTVCTLPDELLK